MKPLCTLFPIFALVAPVFSAPVLKLEAGALKVDLSDRGRLLRLYGAETDRDYLHPNRESFLIQLKRYSGKELMAPRRLEILSSEGASVRVKLVFDRETALRVLLRRERGWIHMEIEGAEGLEDIDAVRWGPYYTTIVGAVGEFFGVLHAGKATLGLMTLEPNTDGECIGGDGRINLMASHATCARWLSYPEKGSYLLLDSLDHTRKRKIRFLRYSKSLPGVTVVGSKGALYLARKGVELDLIERIVKKEGLPYPTVEGEWVKRSKKILAPSVWSYYDERTVDSVIEFCAAIGGDNICPFSHMFGNWGHFDLDPKAYPGGWDAVRKISERCRRKGIKTTMYTLTNFLKPISIPERYITPHVDPRFAAYDVTSRLLRGIDGKAKEIEIEGNDDLKKLLGEGRDSQKARVVLRNETVAGDDLVASVGEEFQETPAQVVGIHGLLRPPPLAATEPVFRWPAGSPPGRPGAAGAPRDSAAGGLLAAAGPPAGVSTPAALSFAAFSRLKESRSFSSISRRDFSLISSKEE